MILDKDIDHSNYSTFKDCQILSDGLEVKFTMACGDYYLVPLEYLIQWSKEHKNRVHTELLLQKCSISQRGSIVNIYFNDNSKFEVAWDTVLMACEKRYEHFGGLTEESKKIVNGWFGKNLDGKGC